MDKDQAQKTETAEEIKGELDVIKQKTLTALITLGKELETLSEKKQEFLQLFQAYDALSTPQEKQAYQQMMAKQIKGEN